MTLSEKIYWCRKKTGLSQEALAERIGVSRQSISKWETGDASPDISKLPLLAREFGVTIDWLLSDETTPEAEPAAAPDEAAGTHEQNAPHWPMWVENLPGFISRAIKRFGWLYGVRVAVTGALFSAFGILMRLITNQFFRSAQSISPSLGGMNTMTWYDAAGNVVDTPAYAGQVLDSIGGMSGSTISMTATPAGSSAFNAISSFVIVIGVLIMIAGVALAVFLKKWGERTA